MGLTQKQKDKIDKIIYDDKPMPADMTMKDVIKKAFKLPEDEFEKISEEIADYVEAFYERIMGLKHEVQQ